MQTGVTLQRRGHRVARTRGGFPLILLAFLIAGALIAVISGVFGVGRAAARGLGQSASEGEALFQQKCISCHTIGRGPLVGPDLAGITTRQDHDWLVRWITAPDQLLAEKDPIAVKLLAEYRNVPMPNLGLTPDQVTSLLDYLATQTGASAAAPAAAPAPALPAGDPVLGRNLFTGITRMQNGGPPCMACHNVAGIGALGGGALGPNLDPAYQKYGASGLASILASPPFPTMLPIFSSHPLTLNEQANILAFLQQAPATARPAPEIEQLAGLAIAGTLILLGIAQVTWRHRLRAVRRPMLQRRG